MKLPLVPTPDPPEAEEPAGPAMLTAIAHRMLALEERIQRTSQLSSALALLHVPNSDVVPRAIDLLERAGMKDVRRFVFLGADRELVTREILAFADREGLL